MKQLSINTLYLYNRSCLHCCARPWPKTLYLYNRSCTHCCARLWPKTLYLYNRSCTHCCARPWPKTLYLYNRSCTHCCARLWPKSCIICRRLRRNVLQGGFIDIDYLRNKSSKPECVVSFDMGWRILIFYLKLEARNKIY
jgi:hypothetical protein